MKTRNIAVEALMNRFGIPTVGTYVHHLDIAAAIGIKEKTQTYYGVVGKWRKHLLRTYGLDLRCDIGVGYKVLDDTEKVHVGVHRIHAGIKIARKGADVVRRADRSKLPEDARTVADRVVEADAMVQAAMRNMPKRLPIPLDTQRRVSFPLPKL